MSTAVHTSPIDVAGFDSIDSLDAALWMFRGVAEPMLRPHRHDDLELNFVLRGRLDYLFGGTRVAVEAGQIALFWGATTHGLVDQDTGDPGDTCWVHIPLTTVLGWRLPAHDLNEILSNRPIILPADAAAHDVEEMFESWAGDIGNDETESVALLEAHALVRRLMRYHREVAAAPAHPNPSGAAAGTDAVSRVLAMAQHIVTHFRDPIGPSDITDIAHLNPNYAMSLFRTTFGTTVGDYLTRCRVAEAQRLLITTSMSASEIAHAAGFGSQSSFYSRFSRMCATSPAEYRAQHR
ncbi:helix-turn-helix domain-containing protein [Cryobacterium sp.]|jgi:AraC-like DNA-binding protein|uniref:helix-turn-helix domain-containing protein n=1 Tax=Cryobacterium sp. TaxID=1926290 RepID=UPI00262BB95B|nr:helix-turn-helix domain-containing protein [Cryobacterium sp.]MCU1446116.1 hypothetical protein [Cryobacterium sp.]